MKMPLSIFILSLVLMGCPSKESTPSPDSSPSPVASAAEEMDGGNLTGALQADVQLNQEVYRPGDEIEIVAVATGLSDTAWVGIVPSDIPHGEEKQNDANNLGYVYLKDNKRLVLVAPSKEGEYDIRFNDDDAEGKEIASRSFRVESDAAPVTQPTIKLNGDSVVKPGATLKVQFEAPITFVKDAWIGIVPSATAHGEEVVNDSANLGYQFIDGRSRGSVELVAPTEPGKFDVRMFDTDHEGKEVGSFSFEVSVD